MWIIGFLWLKPLSIQLTQNSIRLISLLMGLIALILFARGIKKEVVDRVSRTERIFCVVLLAIALISMTVHLYAFRNEVVGPGVDSMHHTLIPDLIIKNGMLPSNYEQYAPVLTFSYHFGYHIFIAVLSLLSGVKTTALVIASTGILMAMITFAAGAVVFQFTRKTVPSLISAMVIAGIFCFPSYTVYWGRFPQLLGTIIGFAWISCLDFWRRETQQSFKLALLLGLMTLALFISHYRICTAFLFFGIIYLTFNIQIFKSKQRIGEVFLAVTVFAVATLPWLINLLQAPGIGYPFQMVENGTAINNLFFSLDRLGPYIKDTLSITIIALTIIFLSLGIIRKNKEIIILGIWVVIMIVVTRPAILGNYIDPVSMAMASYVPLSLIIGLGSAELFQILPAKMNLGVQVIFILLSIAGLVQGFNRWANIDLSLNTFVNTGDLKAAEWIKANTPSNSKFLIYPYKFEFSDEMVVGLDAGYWLPVIAQRATTAPPMVYNIERLSAPAANLDSVKAASVAADLRDVNNLEWLRSKGIEYYYLDTQKNYPANTAVILSQGWKIVYSAEQVTIYKLK
ncbi:MAG TPA: hypothetical protein VLR89_05620 [Anaerolineaceae bacterium]|nr:hypothetical protein [Anaerolineaceae bacterium]